MPTEIERKYLVRKEQWDLIQKPLPKHIVQGYLFNVGHKSCRIRIVNHSKAILNIKQEIDALHRNEFEVQLPLEEARNLLEIMAEGFIEKQRYEFWEGRFIWEVDVFGGNNEGLIVAEIELGHADECYEKPEWLGEEVTHDKRYLNTNLAIRPFKIW